jgi:hypothetical protein
MFEKQHERNGHPFLQFNKPVVGNQPRKKVFQMNQGIIGVKAFKITELSIVKKDKEAHYFRIGKVGLPVTNPVRWVLDEVFLDFSFKINTKIINKDENFSNFIS